MSVMSAKFAPFVELRIVVVVLGVVLVWLGGWWKTLGLGVL